MQPPPRRVLLRRSLLPTVLLASAALAVATRARAHDPPAAADATESTLVPPRPIDTPPPPYPEGATEAAIVIVTFVVEADGSVGEIRAADGPPRWALLAREAVQRWRFEPARRGDKPVAAVVRFSLDFTPPPPPPPPPAAAAGRPEPDPRGGQAVEEVVIRGKKPPPPPPARLGRSEIRQLPGALGDPLRSIEILPGITPTVSGLPYFYARGAPPSTMAYYLDDVPLPYLFHVGLGPSIVHPALISGVSLEPGGGHPRFGRAVGSFIAATTTPPAEDITWEGRVRAIDASAFAAAPLADGKLHAAVGTTASYTGPLLNAFAPEYTIDYRDYSTRVSYDVTPKDRITLFSLGSYDYVSQLDTGVDRLLFASEIYRVDLKWDHALEDGGDLRVGTTWGYDRSRLIGKRFASDQSIAARASLREKLGTQWTAEVGLDTRVDAYDADLPSPYSLTRPDYEESARIYASHADTVTGTYGALAWRPRPILEVMTGLRADVYTSQGQVVPVLEPRTTLVLAPLPRVRLLTSHGLSHQTPSYALPIPAVALPGLPGGLQRALQSSVTGELTGPLALVGAATAFHSAFTNLTDFVLLQSDLPFKRNPPLRGASTGLELSLRRPLTHWWGLQVSYTLSRATRSEDNGKERLSSYDRPHVLNVALTFDLGKGWTTGLRALLYSGLLRDPESGSDERLPSFFRLDARVAKRWSWGKTGYFGVVAEAINATASREVIAYRCNDVGCTPRVIGPLTLPSLGIEGGM